MGETESVRDKSFVYVHSIPFYYELAERFLKLERGQEIAEIFQKSNENYLVKFKKFFFDTVIIDTEMNRKTLLAQSLQRIISFKKDSDNVILMYVKTGKPELSMELGETFSEMVRDIILNNESYDVKVSAHHFEELLEESKNKIEKVQSQLLNFEENQQTTKNSVGTPLASVELEKEIRLAKVEVQRIDLLIRKLKKQIEENSTYSLGSGNYKYVDQISLERLSELKLTRDAANAKVSSLERSYDKFKEETQDMPKNEQIFTNLKWKHELEQSIYKDLVIKNREIEGVMKLLDNSVRIIGQTSLVPVKFKFSRPLKFIVGFIIGLIISCLSVFYFYDFYEVIKGNRELRKFGDFKILSSIPLIKVKNKLDTWKELPPNHHAMEAFRELMENAEGARVITFLSSERGVGKSFIIANIAINMARYGKKILVVDTNFDHPTLSNEFKEGFNVKVINAEIFKHNKNSYLDRSLLIKEIKKYSTDFDIILIDTQDVAHSSDGLVAASVANLNIVVTSYLETYHHKFYNLLNKMKVSEFNNYKVVLNKANLNNENLFFRGNVRVLDDIDTDPVYLKKSS